MSIRSSELTVSSMQQILNKVCYYHSRSKSNNHNNHIGNNSNMSRMNQICWRRSMMRGILLSWAMVEITIVTRTCMRWKIHRVHPCLARWGTLSESTTVDLVGVVVGNTVMMSTPTWSSLTLSVTCYSMTHDYEWIVPPHYVIPFFSQSCRLRHVKLMRCAPNDKEMCNRQMYLYIICIPTHIHINKVYFVI